jgi:hypothetical protein
VLQKNSATNYDTSWLTLAGGGNVSNSGTPVAGQTSIWTGATTIKGVTPDSANGAAANTAGTVSTAGVMAGLGQYVTPTKNGSVLAICCGYAGCSQLQRIVMGGFRYGTGTKPVHGAAIVGTDPGGGLFTLYTAIAGQYAPFCIAVVVTGLTVGTQYWFDIWYGVNGGTGTLYSSAVTVLEF